MLMIEIGWDGMIESFEGEEGYGQVAIGDEFYQIDDDGMVAEKVTVH